MATSADVVPAIFPHVSIGLQTGEAIRTRRIVRSKAKPRALLSEFENLAVGIVGGTTETCMLMPILTWKFCAQEGRALPKSLGGFYRGVGVQAVNVAPITAFQMFLNGIFEKHVFGATDTKPLSDIGKLGAACMAGACSSILYSPVDLTMLHQQKRLLGPLQTLQWIYTTHGPNTLWRGLIATAVREGLYTAGYLGLAPVFASRLSQLPGREESHLSNTLVGSMGAGVIAALLTHPSDTAKTVYQADIEGVKYTSATGSLPRLYEEGGISAFFRGCIPRTVRVCGAFFIVASMREGLIQYKTSNLYA
jgi:hypothetical protein|mmetsp:Transcript_29672/g.47794  ORF Transcript_29672/g.47794 Transcript_29672/m.47794 type:complete len:307 (+) Transcript_29672:47-967(+)